ncbi:MAG: hypothetical protein EBQ80_04250 [Proteobacteria bacterium]|nr:hypothetical protein [Pseudomonadota bacterium]
MAKTLTLNVVIPNAEVDPGSVEEVLKVLFYNLGQENQVKASLIGDASEPTIKLPSLDIKDIDLILTALDRPFNVVVDNTPPPAAEGETAEGE